MRYETFRANIELVLQQEQEQLMMNARSKSKKTLKPQYSINLKKKNAHNIHTRKSTRDGSDEDDQDDEESSEDYGELDENDPINSLIRDLSSKKITLENQDDVLNKLADLLINVNTNNPN
jgi:hypothetical protein